jgi:histidinol-phosphate aminotransferase
MDIALYQGGAGACGGQVQRAEAILQREPLGPSPPRARPFPAPCTTCTAIPTPTTPAARRPSGRCTGWTPPASSAASARTRSSTSSVRPMPAPGDEVIHTEHGFPDVPHQRPGRGATPVEVPERDAGDRCGRHPCRLHRPHAAGLSGQPQQPHRHDDRCRRGPPAGRGLPPQAILVLDGAYAEYVEGYDGGAALIDERDNVVMTRTFSKIYGLGRLAHRLGLRPAADHRRAEPGPRPVQPVHRCSWPPPRPRARSGLRGQVPRRERPHAHWLAEALAEMGVPSDTSTANFVLARFADAAEAEACDAICVTRAS